MVATRKRKYGDDAPTLAEHRAMDGSILQVLECVLSQLAAVDVCRLSAVCKAWDTVTKTNHVWKSICEREGVDLQVEMQANSDDGRCYKSSYKEYWSLRKKWMTGEGTTTFRKKLTTPAGQNLRGHCLAVSSRHIFMTSDLYDHHNIHVFATGDGQYSHQLVGLARHPGSLLLSHDGMKAVAHADSVVCVWNVDSPQSIHSFDHPAKIGGMVVHDQIVAVSLNEGYSPNVFVWSIESGLLLHRLAVVNQVSRMVMDAHYIALHGDSGRKLQLWDVNTGAHLHTCTETGSFYELLLDKATSSLVCLSSKRLSIWDTGTGIRRTRIDGTHNVWYSAMTMHCGKLVVAKTTADINWKQSMFVFDLKQSRAIFDSVSTVPSHNLCGQMSSVHGGLALIVSPSGINLWDVKSRQFIRQISLGEQQVMVCWVKASSKDLHIVVEIDSSLTYVRYTLGD